MIGEIFLCNFHTIWSELGQYDRKIILIKNGEAFDINQEENFPELRSNQEDTDSRVAFDCNYAAEHGFRYARIKSPDSDVSCHGNRHYYPLR